ncbi:DUF4406 domain-containing protein [Comamonas sp. MYb396]|uniref:DUF4406 domain-containing protein n=1 Tax=Comamonas sp. MYb396 TaxID=2745302 RepID=UPI0030971C2D
MSNENSSSAPLKTAGVSLAEHRANRIYVAGPMTGLPDFNFPAFNTAANELRAEGWHVENPAEHGILDGAQWSDYMHTDLQQLSTCCAIYLLPGWSKSRGATLEAHVAQALGMAVYYAPNAEAEAVAAQAAPAAVAVPLIARSLAEWHEDDGAVAWWAWCGHSWAGEAPFIGMPCDSDWPGYHTHWTPAPSQPAGLNATPKPPATEDSSAGDPAEVLAEPVMIYHGRCTIDCGEHGHHDVEMLKMIPAGAKLYTAPQAQPADALDAARLDFLETQKRREARDGGYSAFYTLHLPAMAAGPWQATHGGEYDHKTLRESIDAAMAAAQEGGNASAGKDGAA